MNTCNVYCKSCHSFSLETAAQIDFSLLRGPCPPSSVKLLLSCNLFQNLENQLANTLCIEIGHGMLYLFMHLLT